MISSRRQFLKHSALLAAPAFIPSLRAASPNGKIRHASVGANGQAWGDLVSFASHKDFELVAVADVDSRNHAQVKSRFPNARCYQDWREMFEKEKELDSVNVSIPDHMHGLVTVTALNRGLHTYTQKPLTQNLWECRELMLKAREKKAMTQMGIQISSAFTERWAVDYIRSGVIGKVKEVHTFSSKTWGDPTPRPDTRDTPPADFDWDLWLGVALDRPFIGHGYYHPGNWRKRRDFGTGTLGDMGCHMFSGWFRALDLKSILSVKSTGPEAGKDNWAINGQVQYVFEGTQYTEGKTVPVTWYDGSQRPAKEVLDLIGGKFPDQGSIYLGTDGVLLAQHMSTPMLFPREKFAAKRPAKLEPRDHYHEFLNCVKNGGDKPSANFDYASPLTEAVLLGCLASVFPNETLAWDTAKLEFPKHADATKLVRRNYRKGWEWPA
ncbi:MAG: Gfo/Idh/MocA family oxidoreductase [Verrucomicrobiales bacterium]|nr:Gfo/Idh/MocA family oxidoreductase [Verrucomicrobiales bacterium]